MKGLEFLLYQPLSTAGAVSSGKGASYGAKLIRQRVPAVSHPALRGHDRCLDQGCGATVGWWQSVRACFSRHEREGPVF